jgi:hypothetical protein
MQDPLGRRANGGDTEEVEMYGNELLIGNPSDHAIEVRIRKRRNQDELISEVLCEEKPLMWTNEVEHLVFGERIGSRGEKRFRVVYREQAHGEHVRRSLSFELSVAVRRILSEFRDDYLARSRFLSAPADILKSVLRKAI